MKELRIATRDLDGSVTVLDLDGALDKRTTPDLERAMTGLTDKGRLRLVVNCEKLTYMSSDGMGVFLSHLIRIRKTGGDIKFCNMRDEVRTVVSYLGVAKLLAIRETEREAVADFKKSDAPKEEKKEGEKLTVKVEDRGGVQVVSLFGFIDRHTIALIDSALKGCIEKNKSKIVVDCAELTYMNSNGAGVFVSYLTKARNLGGDIKFAAMRDVVKSVITILGLHRLFEVFETRDQAVESYKRK